MAVTNDDLHPLAWVAMKSYVQVVCLGFNIGPAIIQVLYDPLKYCECIAVQKLSKARGYAMRTFSRSEGSKY